MEKKVIGLAVFLSFSIILNVIVFSFYLEKYDIPELFERLDNLNKNKKLELPIIPKIYEENILSMEFEKNVTTKEDFVMWGSTISKKFSEMYNLEDLEDVELNNLKIEFIQENDSNILTKYSASALDDDKIIFYELKPTNQIQPKQAIFIIPGSGNQGASDVLNLESDFEDYYYHKNIGQVLVNEGFIVYVIENRGWGERTIDAGLYCENENVYCSGNVLRNYLPSVGKDLFSLQIKDSLQVFNFIKTQEYVDSKNIAVIGLSLGGGIAQGLAVIEPEIKSVALPSGLVSFYKTKATGSTHGMLEFFDFPDLVASIAPKPVYLSWGENEKSSFRFEVETSYSANIVKKSYAILDAEENVTVVFHKDKFNQGHTLDIDTLLQFLTNTLGRPHN